MNMRSQRGSAPRRSLIVDGNLAAGLAAFVTVGTYFASQHQPTRRPFDAGTIALISVAAGALALRRRHPVAVMTVGSLLPDGGHHIGTEAVTEGVRSLGASAS